MTTTYRIIDDALLGRLIRAAGAFELAQLEGVVPTTVAPATVATLAVDLGRARFIRRYMPFERDEAQRCAQRMVDRGGHFFRAIGVAHQYADSGNAARLQAAFAGAFVDYDDESEGERYSRSRRTLAGDGFGA